MLKQLYYISFLTFLTSLFSISAFAQNTEGISGKITDNLTGNPYTGCKCSN